jgi:dTMP kinase
VTTRGAFIAFEGGEGCGKSTQAARLATRRGAVLTREPGGTPLGERVRAIFLDPQAEVDAWAEVLLVAAARAQLVSDVIGPALAEGRDVVTDRFSGSSLAYQGYGRGLPVDAVGRISGFATRGIEPEVVVLLDVSAEVAASRLGAERDRLESAGEEFHARVREGYRELAASHERWLVIDGSRSVDEVEAAVWEAVSGRLGW